MHPPPTSLLWTRSTLAPITMALKEGGPKASLERPPRQAVNLWPNLQNTGKQVTSYRPSFCPAPQHLHLALTSVVVDKSIYRSPCAALLISGKDKVQSGCITFFDLPALMEDKNACGHMDTCSASPKRVF